MKKIYKQKKTGNTRPLFCIIMATLLGLHSANAQNNFVGDGFGGRSWYKPSNIECGENISMANINGQMYAWGSVTHANNGSATIPRGPMPIPYSLNLGGRVIAPSQLQGVQYLYPQSITSLTNIKLISLSNVGAAIKTDGSGWVWGGDWAENDFISSTPLQVISSGCKHLATSQKSAIFVKDDGTVWSVGYNPDGLFGNGATNSALTTTPVQMTGITNAVRVAIAKSGFGYTSYSGTQYTGSKSNCFGGTIILKSDGTVWATGSFTSITPSTTPFQIAGLSNIVDIKGGFGFGMALTATGDVYTWGYGKPVPTTSTAPVKMIFPASAGPIIAIFADQKLPELFALDESAILYYAANDLESRSSLKGSALNTVGGLDAFNISPTKASNYVADVVLDSYGSYVSGGVPKKAYMLRTNDYPAPERLWVTGAVVQVDKLSDWTGGRDTASIAILPGTWGMGIQDGYAWVPCSPSAFGLPGPIGPIDLTAGTIDCNKTQLIPAPVVGQPKQIDLVVTVNVTVAGCFTPLSVSGSGFSIPAGFTQKCVTTTGIQQLHIPVNYDGSALGTLNFTVGQAGACVADLTKAPVKKEVNVWTLDNCTLVNVAPVLK